MKCNDIHVLINNFLDGALSDKEALEFESHIETCEKCREEFEEIQFIHEIMADSELTSLPENFEEELNAKLISVNINEENLNLEDASNASNYKSNSMIDKSSKEDRSKSKTIDFNIFKENRTISYMKKHKRVISSLAAMLMIGVFTISSMDSISRYTDKSYDESDANYEVVVEEKAPMLMTTMSVDSDQSTNAERGNKSSKMVTFNEESFSAVEAESASDISTYTMATSDDAEVASAEVNYKEDRLIIKNGYTSIEVLDFDKTMDEIKLFVNASGGYVSDLSSSEYGGYNEMKDRNYKSGYVNVRIPKHVFDQMFNEISSYGNIESTSISTSDITDSYRGISDEIVNLEIREKKLREIMEKTVEIKDVIEVERELSRVRGEINRLSGTLQNWESLVELSSINIQIREVSTLNKYIKPVDATLFEQAKYALIRSLNNLMLFIERFIIAFVGNIPNLVVIAILAIIARFIYIRRRN